ncbi:hypothetical protein TRVL_06091 [Trypanosoma vivax]|nr:hypothetical protein TRVL_06091 [Trypanosoma vivax]
MNACWTTNAEVGKCLPWWHLDVQPSPGGGCSGRHATRVDRSEVRKSDLLEHIGKLRTARSLGGERRFAAVWPADTHCKLNDLVAVSVKTERKNTNKNRTGSKTEFLRAAEWNGR